jgi:hypothetical protein
MVDWVAKLGNSKGLPTLLTGRAMRKRAILSASAAPLAPFSKAVALVIGRSRGRQGISTFHFTLAFVCVFFCVTGARAQMLAPQGRPVTAEDIVGKKVCWDNGRWGLYAAMASSQMTARAVSTTTGRSLSWGLSKRGITTVRWRSCPTDNFTPARSKAAQAATQTSTIGEKCAVEFGLKTGVQPRLWGSW